MHHVLHNWTVYNGSGFGKALKLRHCNMCNRFETYMFDIYEQRCVWVPGNFMEDLSSPIFIVAEEQESLKEVLQSEHFPKGADYRHVRKTSDLEAMTKYRQPRFILAVDWKETSLSGADEFRVLCNTGHF